VPGFVKTQADEKKWSKAKKAAGTGKWALANYIFHRGKGKKKGKSRMAAWAAKARSKSA